jgi:hemoglobin/transferrin/lactoferrin receptor protein
MEHAENTFDRTVIQNGIKIPSSIPNYFDPADLYRAEVFTEDTLRKGRWSLTGGLRGGTYRIVPDNSAAYLAGTGNSPREDYANSSILPSLSVDYELSPSARLWARYARNVRNPSMEDYVGYFDHGTDFYQIPNPDLEAETADGVEAGIKYSSASFDAELSGFYTLYDGFIDQVATGNTSGGKDEITLDNVGEVEIYGTDLSLTYRPGARWEPLDGFSAGTRIGYTYGWNRTRQDFQDSVDPFQTVLMIGYDDPAGVWGVRLIGTYRARKTEVSNDWNSFVPPSSFVLDGTAYWNITEKVSVELAVRNLTDEKYWIWPNSGRLDHDFNENPELAVQPGINGLLTLNVKF